MVCGEALTYHEKAENLSCCYCGSTEPGHISCSQGHYICDPCHNKDAMKVIENVIASSTSTNAFEIAELAMSHPGLPMLGCQHAYIAGGALIASVRNEGSRVVSDSDIAEVFQRTGKQAHGGYCGLSGVCGISPAIGACFAVLTGSKCGTDEEQRITMEAVTRVTRSIKDLTGPSCCKAYVRASLDAAVDYLEESLNIVLPRSVETSCIHDLKHPHGCRTTECPYFRNNGRGGVTTTSVSSAANAAIDNGIPESPASNRRVEGTMEDLLSRARELGAEEAKVIDPSTVVVEEWVRWKCRYGCALLGHDGCHPPDAPDAESTKRVLKEYTSAILMKGEKGKLLTEVAVRLEGEAYHKGYYKAFALTALSSAPPGAS